MMMEWYNLYKALNSASYIISDNQTTCYMPNHVALHYFILQMIAKYFKKQIK